MREWGEGNSGREGEEQGKVENILTLFLGSFRLNIKLLYLFLYLASVSRKKEKSSFSILVATFAAFSSGTFKFDSVSLKIRTI